MIGRLFKFRANSNGTKKNQIDYIAETGANDQHYEYNSAGSITGIYEVVNQNNVYKEKFLWTEGQNLMAVANGGGIHHYLYDQNGQRVMKSSLRQQTVSYNGQTISTLILDPYTVYVNPYFIANHYTETVEASKHYYMGSIRVASSLISYPYVAEQEGGLPESGSNTYGSVVNLLAVLDDFGKTDGVDYEEELLLGTQSISDYDFTQGDENFGCNGDVRCLCEHSRYMFPLVTANCNTVHVIYWYHPDYLGNTEYITDWNGNPYQFFWYSPWGESLVSQHKFDNPDPSTNYYRSPFSFNAKELDAETGNYYYGARYYDPKVSVWLSVDPKAQKYPTMSPYIFVANNPVMLIDPNGMEIDWGGNLMGALRGWLEMKVLGTTKTQQQWHDMKVDPNTLYTINYKKTVGIGTNPNTLQMGIAEGMTEPDVAAGINPNTDNDYRHVNINLHLGTRKLKKEIMRSQGVTAWSAVGNVDPNTILQSGNYKIFNYDDNTISNGNATSWNFGPFNNPVNPNSGETKLQWGQRVLGHESVHALTWGGKWPQRTRAFGGPQNQGEGDAQEAEQTIIDQQR